MQPRDLLWESFSVPWPFLVVHSVRPFLYVAPWLGSFFMHLYLKVDILTPPGLIRVTFFLKPFLTTGIGWLPSLDISLPCYQSTYNTLTHVFFLFLSDSAVLWEDKDYLFMHCHVLHPNILLYGKGLITFLEMNDDIVPAVVGSAASAEVVSQRRLNPINCLL